jgi:hypothetical protein
MAMKKGLGKGLDSMIPEKKTKAEMKEAQDKSLAEIKISEIDPNMGQPRKKFDEDELLELAESIKIHGVIQPIILTKRGKRYEIIAGERRWRASKLAGLVKIPAVIREYTDKEIMEVSLVENIQRQDLNPIEEALAFKNLIDEYKMKQDDLAERVSKSRSAITNALRLLKLDDKVKAMLAEGLISTGHARALLAVEDKNKQQILATKIFDEKLSVRETEKLVKQILENKEPKKEEKPSEKLIYKKLEDSLKSIIGSKVSIKGRDNGKGKIEIDYYSIEELDRITELLSTIKK